MIAAFVGVVATVVVVAASFVVGRRSQSSEQGDSSGEPDVKPGPPLEDPATDEPGPNRPASTPKHAKLPSNRGKNSPVALGVGPPAGKQPPSNRPRPPSFAPTESSGGESNSSDGPTPETSLPPSSGDIVSSSLEPPTTAVDPSASDAGRTRNAAAQVQDHGSDTRSAPNSDASGEEQDDAGPQPLGTDPERPFRAFVGLRVDGSTSWALRPPADGFSLRAQLEARLQRGARSVKLVDAHGEVVAFALERAKGGGVKLLTGALVLLFWAQFLEIQIRAVAVETEGLESWFMRELPRAIWWALGVRLADRASPRELADDLHELGVYQRRLELCLDIQGLALYPGLAHHLVGGPVKTPRVPKPGVETGVEIGRRSRHPLSMVIYDKLAELSSQRGPEHAALLGTLRDAGYEPGSPLLRIEVRLQGPGLVLETDDGVLDGSHPYAALDRGLLGRLWWDSLTRVWLADASHGAGRMRDNRMHPVWKAARQAGCEAGDVAFARTRRAALTRQLGSSQVHANEQLGRALAASVALAGGQELSEIPELARQAVDTALDHQRLGEWFLRARARYRVLLDGTLEAQASPGPDTSP